MDEVTNWYKHIKGSGIKKDKNYSKHMIDAGSMILCIGGTGSGKSTALLEFLSRCPEKYYEIILFSGSGNSSTEPLYRLLKEKIPEVQCYDDINEVPELESFEDKNHEKLIVWDDFLQLNPKGMRKLAQYITASRKSGFSNWFMSQSYTAVPKIISRNATHLLLFKLNDNYSLKTIIKNHNQHSIPDNDFKELHRTITEQPRSFMMIDLKNRTLRRNFTDILEKC
jgi:hypothetical protein